MMPTSYARTLRRIVEGALRLCGDFVAPGADGRLFAWTEVEDAVNDVLLEFVRETEVLHDVGLVALQEDVAVYDLPPDCLRPIRLSLHGRSGHVILPTTLDQVDVCGGSIATGEPVKFFRELLGPNQIGVVPAPSQTGSTYTADSDYGLIRRITAGAEEMEMEVPPGALRSIRGVPMVRGGRGGILRWVASTAGNLLVEYARTCDRLTGRDTYPDPDLPEWIHKDLKFPTAARLLRYKRDKLSQAKVKVFNARWLAVVANTRRWCEQSGTIGIGVHPL